MVVLNSDADELSQCTLSSTDKHSSAIPAKRSTIHGFGPVSQETARRIACDASVVSITSKNGEPLDISRKSRKWTPALSRVIHNRDQHCQWPGCTATQRLHIHHIKHWADEGTTSAENGVLCCHFHHVLLHEGGYRFERVPAIGSESEAHTNQQFDAQKLRKDGAPQSFEEIALRNNRESFNAVQALLSTRYRFRVISAEGLEVSQIACSQPQSKPKPQPQPTPKLLTHYTRVESDISDSSNYPDSSNRSDCPASHPETHAENHLENQISEPSAFYRVDVSVPRYKLPLAHLNLDQNTAALHRCQ